MRERAGSTASGRARGTSISGPSGGGFGGSSPDLLEGLHLGGSFDGRPRSGRAAALARQARANKAGAAGGGDKSFSGPPQMEKGSGAPPAFADLEGTQYIDL